MKREFILMVLCFVFVLFGGLFAQEGRAATRTVDNTSDNGALTACSDFVANDCSLRGAISGAAAGDTVNFDPVVFNSAQTITLTNGHITLTANNLTVTGVGASHVTISGNNASRVFSVIANISVTINSLKITRGFVGVGQGGGGILNQGLLTVINSLIYQNSAGSVGGGIYNLNDSEVRLINSTVSLNTAAEGGGIFNAGATSILRVTNSTLVSNTATSFGGGGIKTSGQAHVSNTIVTGNTPDQVLGGMLTNNHNLIGGNPQLSTLGNHGGPTDTYAILPGSPAIDAGDPLVTIGDELLRDQRGFGRPTDGNGDGNFIIDIGAFEYGNVVTNVNDNTSPAGSLRNAVNNAPANSEIFFDPNFFSVPRVIDLFTLQELFITKNLTIIGPGANLLTVNRSNGNFRIFNVLPNVAFNLSRMTLANGKAPGGNGGAINNDGTVNGSNLVIENSTANVGGGIYNAGTLSLSNSTFSGNTAALGGAIANNGTLSLTNATVSANTSTGKGAGIYNDFNRIVNVVNSTITNNNSPNIAGAGAYNDNFAAGSNTFNARNTIIAGNISPFSPADFVGDLNNQGFNIIGGNAQLLPLVNYGGTTPTHALSCGSPAVDAADPNNVLPTDQRGMARPVNGRADIGAYEAVCSINVINNASGGVGSLRDAIEDIDFGGTIRFSAGVTNIALAGSEISINKSVSIDAGGAGPVTIAQNGMSRIFTIGGGTTVILNQLTLTGGGNVSDGGAILSYGTLQMFNSTLTGNNAQLGGAISNNGNLTIVNSTISGNTATNGKGGGIYSDLNRIFMLLNSTITNNQSTQGGAGVWSDNFSNGNTSSARNTIVAGNSPGDYVGDLDNLGSNLIGGNPQLAPLGNYGGTTQTHALLSNSPALNAGDNCILNQSCPSNNLWFSLTSDQRGAPRKIGAAVDIGAFERNITFNQSSLPNGNTHLNYNQQLSATRLSSFAETGGKEAVMVENLAPTQFALVAGQLPPGITLSPGGLLSGMPTTGGTYTFTIKATDTDTMAGVQQFTIQILAPTAANVAVSGRVLTPDGRGLRNAQVILTDSNGNSQTAISSSFGYYRFDYVAVGETYILSVSSKRYQFSPQIVNVIEEINDLNFSPIP